MSKYLKMNEFNKSRVYTALNADEVKVGSKVIVADTLFQLEGCVYNDENIREILEIKNSDTINRFEVGDWKNGYQYYPLCYLISEPEEKKLKWTDLKIGDIIQTKRKNIKAMVTAICDNEETDTHIFAQDFWLSDRVLELEWEKVE